MFVFGSVLGQTRMTKSADLDKETELKSFIEFPIGTITISGTSSKALFNFKGTFSNQNLIPEFSFQRGTTSSTMKIQSKSKSSSGSNTNSTGKDGSQHEADIELNQDVTHYLKFSLGAGDATLNLNHLRFSEFEIASGAASIQLISTVPNSKVIEKVTIRTGVGRLDMNGILNMNIRKLTIEGGVGSVRLDFSGFSVGTHAVNVSTGVGSIQVTIPPNIGIKIKDNSSFFSSVSIPKNMTKRGSTFYSDNYDSAETQLEFNVSSGMGSVNFSIK